MNLHKYIFTVGFFICTTLLFSCTSEEAGDASTNGDLVSSEDGDRHPDDQNAEGDSENETDDDEPTCGDASFGEPLAFEETVVFLGETDGYPVFRIPSIITTPSGVLLAFAEARPTIEDPGSGKIDLVMKRSNDCGRTWSELRVLAENGSGDAHNPVSLTAPDSTGETVAWLFYNMRPASEGGEFDLPPGLGNDSASIWFITSADDGSTWSEPRNITIEVKNPDWAIASMGPGIGIVTRRGTDAAPPGRMVIPGWQTWGIEGELNGSFVILSDDRGGSWCLGGLPEPLTNESQVVELTDGRLLLDARQNGSTESPTRFLYTSEDGGESWFEPSAGIEMTKVMSGIIRWSAIRDGEERDVLLHSGPSAGGRFDLRVWVSYDEALSWVHETIIREGFVQYSVLTVLPDKSIGVLYETAELDDPTFPLSIRFSRFNLTYMTDNETK